MQADAAFNYLVLQQALYQLGNLAYKGFSPKI